jgi:hypothetical protein
MTYGATNDDTDASSATTNAFASAIATAKDVHGIVLIPPGTFRVTGNYDLTGTGVRILGSGIGVTTINLNHASNDLFYVTSASTNLSLSDFTVTSTSTTRTGGWVFRVNCAYNANGYLTESRFTDIMIDHQVNGIWIAQYIFVWLNRIKGRRWVGTGGSGVGAGGIGIKCGQTTSSDINQGSEIYLTNCQVFGNGIDDLTARLDIGYVIEDCDAVYVINSGGGGCVTHTMKVISNSGGHPPANLMFTNLTCDATAKGDSCYFSGGASTNYSDIQIDNSWFCSGGKMHANMVISAATVASPIVITITSEHPFQTGDLITVTGCTGNTNANGAWTITRVDATHFSLNGSTGNSAYTGNGLANSTPGLQAGGFRGDGIGRLQIATSKIFNNRGTGMWFDHSFGRAVGNILAANGQGAVTGHKDGINVLTTNTADLTMSFSANESTGENGYSIATDAETNRAIIDGNLWGSGTSYGVAPQVNANNGA